MDRIVHVVDDDAAVRESTALMLEIAGYSVTCWATGADFMAQAKLRRQDCVILDLRMPGPSGLDVMQYCRESQCSPAIIMLTAHGEISSAVAAMKGGAVDFLQKPYSEDALLAAIKKVFAATAPPNDAASKIATLSRREREVLDELVQGRANKEIAETLGISVRTVELHRTKLLKRLGTRSVAVAVQIALEAVATPSRSR